MIAKSEMLSQLYFQPVSIREAFDILQKFNGEARVIAGGTDLIIDLKNQKKKVTALVDISKIIGLDEIRVSDENICLGAMVNHTQASKSDVIKRFAPALSEACSAIGSPQIRNMGTLIGNIINAMPAADAATALIALGARVKVLSLGRQERLIPIEQLYRDLGKSVVDSTREIATEVEFPMPKAQSGSGFKRLSRRKALTLPILNTAIFIRLDEDLKIFKEARIVVGPVSPLPFRSRLAENLLLESPVSEVVIRQAATASSEEASPRNSLRGGKEYRKEMVKVLVEHAIRQALIRTHPNFSNL